MKTVDELCAIWIYFTCVFFMPFMLINVTLHLLHVTFCLHLDFTPSRLPIYTIPTYLVIYFYKNVIFAHSAYSGCHGNCLYYYSLLSSALLTLRFHTPHLVVDTDMPARFGIYLKHNIWLKERLDCASLHSFMLTVICPLCTSVQCLGPGGHPDWDRRAKSIWTIKLLKKKKHNNNPVGVILNYLQIKWLVYLLQL